MNETLKQKIILYLLTETVFFELQNETKEDYFQIVAIKHFKS